MHVCVNQFAISRSYQRSILLNEMHKLILRGLYCVLTNGILLRPAHDVNLKFFNQKVNLSQENRQNQLSVYIIANGFYLSSSYIICVLMINI